jgi:predicted acyltransferase
MVLVNNPGDWSHLYAPLDHAEWNGWTFTDTIFPFFLFICGVSMAFSLGQRAAAGDDRGALLRQLARRAALIFLIGLTLNLIPNFNFASVRIPGVLQRIALCVLLAAPIVVYLGLRLQCLAIVALLAVYSVLMLWVPVPDGHGTLAAGVLEPGRDFGAFIDRGLLDGHLWAKSKTWDPEGLVSTLPAVCSLLFGVLAGRGLLSAAGKAEKTVWMMIAGLAALGLGVVLDGLLMPINKSLWTPAYCLLMSGWALLLLAVFYWLIDAAPAATLRERAQTALRPFTIYGMNALFIFALSGLIAKMLGFIRVGGLPLKAILFAPLQALPLSANNASLLFAILFNALMWLIAWAMWRRQWFVKV